MIIFDKKSILLLFGIICKRDEIKMRRAVHLIGTDVVGGAFWCMLIGMFALSHLIRNELKTRHPKN